MRWEISLPPPYDNMGVLHTKEMHLNPVIDWGQVTFKNFEIEKIIKEIFKENF